MFYFYLRPKLGSIRCLILIPGGQIPTSSGDISTNRVLPQVPTDLEQTAGKYQARLQRGESCEEIPVEIASNCVKMSGDLHKDVVYSQTKQHLLELYKVSVYLVCTVPECTKCYLWSFLMFPIIRYCCSCCGFSGAVQLALFLTYLMNCQLVGLLTICFMGGQGG